MGRPTKPAHLKLLEGNPGKREIANAIQPTGEAACPDYLSGYARTVWDRIVQSMPPGLYSAADTEILAAYCTACKSHRKAVQQLQLDGHVVIAANGSPVRNPWTYVQNRAADQLASLGGRLGLDPSARAKLTAPGANKLPSKFDGLLG